MSIRKQKVKLVFAKNNVEIPTVNDCFSRDIEIEIPEYITADVHLIAAGVYASEKSVRKDELSEKRHNVSIWDYNDESRLVGKLLTYIDATYADKDQRQAHKDLVKELVYGYSQDIRTRSRQTLDGHE